MFDSFKKLVKPFIPQASFVEPRDVAAAHPLPGLPGALPEQKSRFTRIKDFLPSAIGGAAAVFAAKSCATALCASVSAPALATAATAVAVGAVTSQLITYVRERKAELKAQNGGRDVSLFRDFELAAAKREIKTFFSKDKMVGFGKGALVKGLVGGSIGAAFGLAAQSDYAHKAWDTIKEFNPLEKLQHGLFGKPNSAYSVKAIIEETARVSKISAASAVAPVVPPPEALLSHPLETVPVAPPTPLEKVRILMDVKGLHNAALDKMLERAEAGNSQAMKDLAYGLRWGKLGLVQMKDLANEMLNDAAAKGNAQAIHDQLVLAGKIPSADLPPATPVSPSVAVPEPATLSPAGVADDSRERAAAFIRAAYSTTETPAAAPVTSAATPAATAPIGVATEPPGRLGKEAARCLIEKIQDGNDTIINSICSNFKDVMAKGDSILMETSGSKISETYIYDGETNASTDEFVDDSLLNFAENKLVPALH